MLQLFYWPGTCATAAHIALQEAGANYEGVRVDLTTGAHKSADYLAINPKSRVPALRTDRGVITENTAILTYIAQTHPAAMLAPVDPYDLAQMQSFNSFLASTVHVAFAMQYRAERWADDPVAQVGMKAKAPSGSRQHFELIEARFADGRPWVLGDRYSLADSYLAVFSSWLKARAYAEDRDFPKVSDHRTRTLGRPAARKVLADEGLDWS